MSETRRDIQRLVEAGDWAGLVRYWIARQSEEALDSAIEIVHDRDKRSKGWSQLADYLLRLRRSDLDFEADLSTELSDDLDATQQATLRLLQLYPRASLCQMANQLPAEHQRQLLIVGIENAEQACQIAEQICRVCSQARIPLSSSGATKLLLTTQTTSPTRRPSPHRYTGHLSWR